jgi:uncharacterized protein (DUF952 family)
MVHLANDCYLHRDALARSICDIASLQPTLKYEKRASQTYPHLGQVRLVSRRREGKLRINPLKQLRLHVESDIKIV